MRRWPAYWPVLLFFSCVLLLPFSRLAGVAVAIICIVIIYLGLYRPTEVLTRFKQFFALFAPWWLPMLISVPLAVDLTRSATVSLAAFRFALLGTFALLLLNGLGKHRQLQRWTAWLLALWTVDLLVQVLFGVSLLGIAMPNDRPNGIFGPDHMKLGPTLATLSPLLLVYVSRYGRSFVFPVTWFAVLVALLLIGTRSAWITFAVVSIGLVTREVLQSGRFNWKGPLALILAVVLAAGAAWQLSPQFKQRLQATTQTLVDDNSVDRAVAQRLDIWQGATAMIADRPLTGVGVRGFRVAWPSYQQLDPEHWQSGSAHNALHAHHLILEVLAETGLIGLLGFVVAVVMAARLWRRGTGAQRETAWPYALGLVAALFPLNTHYATYSTFWSLVIMWLFALYASALLSDVEMAIPEANPPP